MAETIHARVLRLAQTRGLSARELANRAGLSSNATSRQGLANPTLSTLTALAGALGLRVEQLVAGLDSAAEAEAAPPRTLTETLQDGADAVARVGLGTKAQQAAWARGDITAEVFPEKGLVRHLRKAKWPSREVRILHWRPLPNTDQVERQEQIALVFPRVMVDALGEWLEGQGRHGHPLYRIPEPERL